MTRLSMLAAPLAAALVQAGEPAAEEPTFYACYATQRGAFGEIWYTINVPVDGRPPFHRIQWQSPLPSEGVRLEVNWQDHAPDGGGFGDGSWVNVRFMTPGRGYGRARIELRRGTAPRYPGQFAYAGAFVRPERWPGTALRYYASEARWDEIKAWMGDDEGLTVALVRRDGEVVARDHLSAATIAMADTALAAVRPELDAMVADYRNRCEVPEPTLIF